MMKDNMFLQLAKILMLLMDLMPKLIKWEPRVHSIFKKQIIRKSIVSFFIESMEFCNIDKDVKEQRR